MRYLLIGLVVVAGLGVYLVRTQPVEQAGPGQVMIRFAFPGDVRALGLYSRVARRFMELNPDIYIKIEPTVGDFRRLVQRDLVAGIAADVFFSDDDYFAVFARDGHYLPLDEPIARDGLDTEDFYEPTLASYRHDGAQYGLPFGWGCSLLLYNKAAFREAKIQYDPLTWTWPEFLDTIKRCTGPATFKGRDVYRYGYMRDNVMHTICHIWQGGGTILRKSIACPHCGHGNDVADLIEPAGATCLDCGQLMKGGAVSWRACCDTPQARAGVEFMESLLPYPPRAVASDASEMSSKEEVFATGRLAIIRGGPYSARWGSGVDLDWGIGYYPAGPGGRWKRFYCDGFVIWSKTKYPEQSWRLLKYLSGRDVQRLMAKDGASIPVRKTVAESPYFNRPDTPWDESIMAKAIGHVRFQRRIPEWDIADQVVRRLYGHLMLEPGRPGKIDAGEFLAESQRQIEREAFGR